MKPFLYLLLVLALLFVIYSVFIYDSPEPSPEVTEEPVSSVQEPEQEPVPEPEPEAAPEDDSATPPEGMYMGTIPSSVPFNSVMVNTIPSVFDSDETEEPTAPEPVIAETHIAEEPLPPPPKKDRAYIIEDYSGIAQAQEVSINSAILSMIRRFGLRAVSEGEVCDYEFYIEATYDNSHGIGKMDSYLVNISTNEMIYWSIPAKRTSEDPFVKEITSSFNYPQNLEF